MKTANQNHMASPKHDINKMIQDILDEFDFDKVRKTMIALKWTWATVPGYPSIDRLKETAEYLLRGCINGAIESKDLHPDSAYFNATGGFKAYCFKNRYKHITSLHLEFIVSEWESDGDY